MTFEGTLRICVGPRARPSRAPAAAGWTSLPSTAQLLKGSKTSSVTASRWPSVGEDRSWHLIAAPPGLPPRQRAVPRSGHVSKEQMCPHPFLPTFLAINRCLQTNSVLAGVSAGSQRPGRCFSVQRPCSPLTIRTPTRQPLAACTRPLAAGPSPTVLFCAAVISPLLVWVPHRLSSPGGGMLLAHRPFLTVVLCLTYAQILLKEAGF